MSQLIYDSSGEIDEHCEVDCACCIDRKCGQGSHYPNECTLGCIDGYTGARCYGKCTYNCTRCEYYAKDICIACYDGYYPGPARNCTSKCLPGCKACTSGTTCTSCKEGYYNTSNLCNSLCPSNCITCSSNTSCMSCKDGYYNGNQKDNIDLPLLNDCTYKCRENCVGCSSYNSCLVCNTGLYGPICAGNCSVGCSADTCDIRTGNCACFPNFTGERCDKCKTGKYGKYCDQQCPRTCKNNVCEKDSGVCTDGCIIDTIIGDKCDVCSTGWYGKHCNLSCSDAKCVTGCEIKEQDDHICRSVSDQQINMVAIVFGTLFAVSFVGNIILVAYLILRKCQQRVNAKTGEEIYENAGVELECGNIANVEGNRTAQGILYFFPSV
ncbi:multiple epidermal growth factor-like domains protein 11 [Ruditapes philippinarum]|uniref:multiple epidermal growth factor-like domains protein 11 n=1 Tax=Ruditapes philippinarum TaxID=129788 RepID=UPI00295C23C2|nr:multiple epidermal growth factor-like domains protein 11 [Ruditapes philippinarum]